MLDKLLVSFLLMFVSLASGASSCPQAELVYAEFLKYDYCNSISRFTEGTAAFHLMTSLCQGEHGNLSEILLEEERSLCDSILLLLMRGSDYMQVGKSGAALPILLGANDLAKGQGETLQKLSLLMLQYLFGSLLDASVVDYRSYLDEFRNLAQRPREQVWLHYYQMTHWSRTASVFALDSMKAAFHRIKAQPVGLGGLQLPYRSAQALIWEHDSMYVRALEEQLNIYREADQFPFLSFLSSRASQRIVMIYTALGKYDEALEWTDTLESFAKGHRRDNILFSVHRRKSFIYRGLEQYERAAHHADSANIYFLTRELQKASQNVAVREVELKVVETEKNLLQSREELSKSRRVRTAYLALLIILGMTALAITYRLRLNRLAKEQFHQELENERQASQIRAINARVDGEEAQRFKIAQYLHDEVAGSLSALKVHLDVASRDKAVPLDKPQQLAAEVGADIRKLSHELFPSILLHRTLSDALQQLCEQYTNDDLRISLVDRSTRTFEQDARVKLYFIVKELLNNVIKHSGASTAIVKLKQENSALVLQVRDDGEGLEPGREEGMGLSMIRARIKSLDGSLTIDGREGYSVTAVIPLGS